jgi:hypothetical protein
MSGLPPTLLDIHAEMDGAENRKESSAAMK